MDFYTVLNNLNDIVCLVFSKHITVRRAFVCCSMKIMLGPSQFWIKLKLAFDFWSSSVIVASISIKNIFLWLSSIFYSYNKESKLLSFISCWLPFTTSTKWWSSFNSSSIKISIPNWSSRYNPNTLSSVLCDLLDLLDLSSWSKTNHLHWILIEHHTPHCCNQI